MTGCWLPAGVFMLLNGLTRNLAAKGLLLGAASFFFLRKKQHRALIVTALALSLMSFLQLRVLPRPTEHLRGTVVRIRKSYFLLAVKGQNIWVYDQGSVNYDDQVELSCRLSEITGLKNRAGFDFAAYARSQNSAYSCYPLATRILSNGRSFRHRVFSLVSALPEDQCEVMRRFLFHSYPDSLSEAGFILMAAGMHISGLLRVLKKICGRFMEYPAAQLTITGILLFMGAVSHFDLLLDRLILKDLLGYTSLPARERWGIVTLAMGVLFPNSMGQLALFLPLSLSLVSCFARRHRYLASLAASIITQLFINGTAYLSQSFYLLTMRPLYSLGYLACLADIWLPLSGPLKLLAALLARTDAGLSSWGALAGKPSFLIWAVMMVLLIDWCAYSHRRSAVFLAALMALSLGQAWLRPYALVTYIDVGQGDSALISLPFNRGNILIDTGGDRHQDLAAAVLLPVLRSYGITRLDYVILTHADFDHSGAYDALAASFPIAHKITEKDDRIRIEGFKIFSLLADRRYDNDNDNSLITYFDLSGVRFLFTGDISRLAEQDLTEEYDALRADVLKAAHHGSATATSQELIETIRPSLAVISSGLNNPYHHPAPEVCRRLKENRVYYLNTAFSGAIEVVPWLGWKIIRTEQGEFAIIRPGP